MHRLGVFFICLGLLGVTGGHWAVLQSIAWVRMIHDYAQDKPLVEAVEKTFNGENPCALCLRVQEGRNHEKKSFPIVHIDKKSEVFPVPDYLVLPQPPSHTFSYPLAYWIEPLFFSEAPQTPPPRSFQA